MTTYCAPCITELALVREATTAVAGTASCTAHAVLLAHAGDAPGRRRQRLAELRKLAEAKRESATEQEDVLLELLIHEYNLAGTMDLGTQNQGGQQRSRGQGGQGGPHGGQQGQGGPHGGQQGQGGAASAPGEGRRSRRGRGRERGEGQSAAEQQGPGAPQPGNRGAGEQGVSEQGGAEQAARALDAAPDDVVLLPGPGGSPGAGPEAESGAGAAPAELAGGLSDGGSGTPSGSSDSGSSDGGNSEGSADSGSTAVHPPSGDTAPAGSAPAPGTATGSEAGEEQRS